MLTDEMKYQLGSALKAQAGALLSAQSSIASSNFTERSGNLVASLKDSPAIEGTSVDIRYPKYIRFLDMKKGKGGVKKKHAPIYNRQVYGFLVSGIRRMLGPIARKSMVRSIQETFTEVKK